jgi:hypothetical protein
MLSHSHPHPILPSSIIVGSCSTLSVSSIGDSVISGLFHLKNVLVASHIIHNLVNIRRFTIDNFCSVEFGPFGLSVKDLATRTLLVCSGSLGRSTHSGYLLPPLPCPLRMPWLPPLRPSIDIVVLDILDSMSCPSCLAALSFLVAGTILIVYVMLVSYAAMLISFPLVPPRLLSLSIFYTVI